MPTKEGSERSYSDLKLQTNISCFPPLQAGFMWLWPLVAKVIMQQKKAYVPGNIFGSCIVNILNLMEYINKKKIKTLILLIDFLKAFNSLSHKYIYKCLKIFNIGPSI